MSKSLEFVLRIVGGLVMTAVLWWLGVVFAGVSTHPQSAGESFLTLAWMAFIALGWFVILGWSLLQSLGDKAGSLFMPPDNRFRIRPEYSIAEARFQQGRYPEAIAAFRQDIEKFPEEVYPHTRIAEIQLEKLGDPNAAIAEMYFALGKTQGAEAFALVADRLADLLQQHRQDRAGAIALMDEIQQRFPGTRQAEIAAERVQRLR